MDLKKTLLNVKRRGAWSNVLTIDPGVHATGWAFWEYLDRQFLGEHQRPDDSGVIRSRAKVWEEAAASVWNDLETVMVMNDPMLIVIEFPGLWSSNAASHASAAKGDLFKLAYLVGGMGHVISERGDVDSTTAKFPILLSPAEWKGQLPKKVVMGRIKRAYGRKYRDHEADSVGLGLFLQGGL